MGANRVKKVLTKSEKEDKSMPSPNEISSVATMTTNAKTAIVNKHASHQNASVLNYYRGDIINSIKLANTRAKNKVNTLISAYSTLNTRLNSLSKAVARLESKNAPMPR